jgi:hypothetical protein
MPSASRARAFTIKAWPLAWVRTTGLAGLACESWWCRGTPSTWGSGRRCHFSWCQPRPRIQAPGFAVRAAPATWATISSQLRAVVRSSCMRASPRPRKWPWPSMKPGTARRPLRSITSVRGPTKAAISPSLPTAVMRSPVIATASAMGRAASTVTTLPWRSTRSAGGWAAPAPRARAPSTEYESLFAMRPF